MTCFINFLILSIETVINQKPVWTDALFYNVIYTYQRLKNIDLFNRFLLTFMLCLGNMLSMWKLTLVSSLNPFLRRAAHHTHRVWVSSLRTPLRTL